jgi:predicted nucleotidyltransferase
MEPRSAVKPSRMPVRSLNSAVFKWPDRETVLAAARTWAAALRQRDPTVAQIVCIGSYARADWGVGSDLDVIVFLTQSDLSALERSRRYHPDEVPVPADLWVYTRAEWEKPASDSPRVAERLQREMLDLA